MAATARKATARKLATSAAATDVGAVTANLPAIVPGAATASNLPAVVVADVAPAAPAAPVAGYAPLVAPEGGWPAAHNSNAWLALLVANVPEVMAARAHKYGAGAGLVPCGAVMFTATAWGAEAGAEGKSTSGKHTVLALVCMAHKLATAALGESKVCGAALAYFAYTLPVLALLQPPHTKTAKYVGKPTSGGLNVPCPAWVSGYINGAARADKLLLTAHK